MSTAKRKPLKKNEPVRVRQKYIDQVYGNKSFIEKLADKNRISEKTGKYWLDTNDERLSTLMNINLIGEACDLSQDIDWFEELLENIY
jgi:hypothetical protein